MSSSRRRSTRDCTDLTKLPTDVTMLEEPGADGPFSVQMPCRKPFSLCAFKSRDVARAAHQFSKARRFTCKGNCRQVKADLVETLRQIIEKSTPKGAGK